MAEFWSAERSRRIVKRLVVTCDLVLQTPAHFGNGDSDELTDMPLLVDPADGRSPLLTGASQAGSLRAYLKAREGGQSVHEVLLFGGAKEDDQGEQSPLIIDDSRGSFVGMEKRHGVKINAQSRTAEHDALYDLHLWEVGTRFPLHMELIIREGKNESGLKIALATALEGLSDGSIRLGMRKRRGFGKVSIESLSVQEYELSSPNWLMAWLKGEAGAPITLGASLPDQRNLWILSADFAVDGSLLIRAGEGQDDTGPDMVHLHSKRNSAPKPILSGTSLTGALRARAYKIINTLKGKQSAESVVDSLFGQMKNKTKLASRLTVDECEITGAVVTNLVQNRVSIDRFTGGARDSALFSQQPAWGGEVRITIRLINPEEHEKGLLLLLLKDLWTGDLPLGGESSVGRGRLKGIRAEINGQTVMTAVGDRLQFSDDRQKITLEKHVTALKDWTLS
ncbi:hypothetical protein ANRL4_03454 [Anaerolineae bacterium]|nr:hypothetical protein ANRL4_03454 [Anaerolineae bacterium]